MGSFLESKFATGLGATLIDGTTTSLLCAFDPTVSKVGGEKI